MIVESGAASTQSEPSESRARLARSLGVLAGGQLVTWVLALAWTVVVPRMLGPTGIGELTTATSATSILLTVVELGLSVLLVRKIAQDRSRAGELMGDALLIQAALYVPALVVMGLFIRSQHFTTEQQIVIWLATGAMLPTILKLPFQSAFQATDNMGSYAATPVIAKFLNSFIGIGLVLLGLGVIAIAALGALVEGLTLYLNYMWSRSRFKAVWHVNVKRAASLAYESLPLSANYIIHATYLWINALMLATLTSAAVVGWYGVSSRLVSTLYFLPVIVSTALLPRFSASFDGRLDALQDRARPAVELVTVTGLPIAVGAALISPPLIDLLYGARFGASSTVLAILLASMPFCYFNILVWQVLVASRLQVTWTKVLAGALVVNVTLNLLLIRYTDARFGDGAIGAAAAVVAAEALMAIAGVVILPQLLNRASYWRIARAGLATAVMGVVVFELRRFGLPIQVVSGAFVFSALALALRVISTAEVREVFSAVRNRRKVRTAA